MATERIHGFCALCWSRCGCISTVEDGRLVAVEPDPEHPTGKALCGKGRAAPELVHHPDRLLHPLKRTRPKGDADPGWERIGWDEALDTIADTLNRLAKESGSETVAFGITTTAGTAMQDGFVWVERLRRAFGSPNAAIAMELCGFAKEMVFPHTFGVPMPVADLAQTDCFILWGHNPSTTWLAHATRIADAKARGATLVVVDPRSAGLANKADQWLRVRPGSDGALALGIAGVMIEEGWFDREFVTRWSNGPFLVRDDTGQLLTGADLDEDGDSAERIAWDAGTGAPLRYDTQSGAYEREDADLALAGRYEIADRTRLHRLPACLRPLRGALPAVPARACRGDHLGASGADSRDRAADRLVGAGLVLRLGRARDAGQREPDQPRHRSALRAHRQLRRRGRQRGAGDHPDQRRDGRRPDVRRPVEQVSRPCGTAARPGNARMDHHGRAL